MIKMDDFGLRFGVYLAAVVLLLAVEAVRAQTSSPTGAPTAEDDDGLSTFVKAAIGVGGVLFLFAVGFLNLALKRVCTKDTVGKDAPDIAALDS